MRYLDTHLYTLQIIVTYIKDAENKKSKRAVVSPLEPAVGWGLTDPLSLVLLAVDMFWTGDKQQNRPCRPSMGILQLPNGTHAGGTGHNNCHRQVPGKIIQKRGLFIKGNNKEEYILNVLLFILHAA